MIKKIILLLVAIVVFVIASTICFIKGYMLFAILNSLLSSGFLVALIAEYYSNTKKLIFMLNAIESNDFNFHFDDQSPKNKTDKLFNYTLNKVKRILEIEKQNMRERERYYETMLQQADIGIMAVDEKNFVQYYNAKALNLLGLSMLTHLKQLEKIDLTLAHSFENIIEDTEQKVSYYNERGKVFLSVGCTCVRIKEKNIKIISLSNIGNELETTEVEAWSRLIRVMTHEIMNSISPIASLSETLSKYYDNNTDEVKEGLEVIHKTSKGLIAFVESYRSLTRISKPIKKAVFCKDLIGDVLRLVNDDLQSNHIDCQVNLSQDDLMLYVDENQISQVVINIIRNAIQARSTQINIVVSLDSDETIRIVFVNNGMPIAKERMEQIFIPFYTTKASGTGIGLSISRQIMQMHNGSIQLLRSTDKETAFVLIFK
ncbi:MAG: ATP-binding protein [Bacteroidales bacterium]|nr:ATP-binding protein [Bacteroidales bacterium]